MPTSAKQWHASNELLIDLDNVSVALGSDLALQDITLCVHPGEFIGVVGQNGAGKTTLLRTILGLQLPTRGQVHRQKIKIGYIPQRGRLYDGIVPISVLEVVRLGSRGAKDTARVALEKVNMSQFAAKRFTELSGGQQQRIIIAKALAGEADILLLDEPTTGVDERSQTSFYHLLRELQQQGITIMMVSHEVDTVLNLATRVICLNQTILYDGDPEHFEVDAYMPSEYRAEHRRLHHAHEVNHV